MQSVGPWAQSGPIQAPKNPRTGQDICTLRGQLFQNFRLGPTHVKLHTSGTRLNGLQGNRAPAPIEMGI